MTREVEASRPAVPAQSVTDEQLEESLEAESVGMVYGLPDAKPGEWLFRDRLDIKAAGVMLPEGTEVHYAVTVATAMKYVRALAQASLAPIAGQAGDDWMTSEFCAMLDGLIEALQTQKQIDEDGTLVGVSREAVHYAVQILSAIAAQPVQDTSAVPSDDGQAFNEWMAQWPEHTERDQIKMFAAFKAGRASAATSPQAPSEAAGQQPVEALRMFCPACRTHEVSLEMTCHNSACDTYAQAVTVYEGWKEGTPPIFSPTAAPAGWRQAMHTIIADALANYRCQHSRTEDGDGWPLADALTPDGDTSVDRGLQEIELLADAIWDELDRAFAASGEQVEPRTVRMSEEQILDLAEQHMTRRECSPGGHCHPVNAVALVRASEAHHGISAGAKGKTHE